MPSRFHGTWRLIAYESLAPDGSVTLPFGENPVGLLVYTPQGAMSGQVMRRDRALLPPSYRKSGSTRQILSAFESYIAYFGTFAVDEKAQQVIHFVEGSLYPNWIGTQQRRGFGFTENRLQLTAVSERKQLLITNRLTWERA